jgi:hypothetical protein
MYKAEREDSPKSTASTKNHHPLSRTNSRTLTRRVSGHTTTHDWTSFFIKHALGNTSSIPPIGEAVLLKRSWSCEARVELLRAVQFVGAVGAEFADAADGDDPWE